MRQRRRFAGHGRGRNANPNAILARTRGAGQPPRIAQPASRPPARVSHDYDFLVGALIDRATLDQAEAEARRCGVATHEVLLAAGLVTEGDYTAVLAWGLGVPPVSWNAALDLADAALDQAPGSIGLPARLGGRPCRILCATEATPSALATRIAALRAIGIAAAMAPPALIAERIEERLRPLRIDAAVRRLLRERPASSAHAPWANWQIIAAPTLAGLLVGGCIVLPSATFAALAAAIAFPFLCVTLLRAVALHQALASTASKTHGSRFRSRPSPDRLLPVYTVLVPLVREANMLSDLVRSLRALDYPAAKLEIFLVLEEDDVETQAAVLGTPLPGNFKALLVPPAGPRTKPKALNYALQFARGDFVVVYDAEDRPEPDQLRRAWEVFRRAPPELGCLQARLNIYNPQQSWLTRQFTIEYSALFDAVLPALERLGLPVPLGGTSNHFPRSVLVGVGAWDPFNVTEDADLGIRLARHGYRTGILASTTWEEAPPALEAWTKQRTRWLKGWMQTYLVHTRELRGLSRDLGWRAATGFHALMGGLVASALAHPIFYAVVTWHWLSGELFAPAETALGAVLWTVAWVNLAVGYIVSILVGVLSVLRRGQPRLATYALLTPLYWLLISFAAYRAVYHLINAPFLWEKTEHGVARRSRRPSPKSRR
jgi:cellulose synthase/poly-beta-1,6-N-acetylglucosamine synthase-like glycosyltransferase